MKNNYYKLNQTYTYTHKHVREDFVDMSKIIYGYCWQQNPFGTFNIYNI
jgi:hypothetical protein